MVTTFAYDVIDQLLSESRNGYSASYTYDANGNRASKTLNGVTQTYVNDAGDKLTSVLQGVTPVKSFTYDAAGRTTAITAGGVTTNFSYAYDDRVTQITRSGMTTNTMSYNGFGARVSKTDSSGSSSFLRNGVGVIAPVLTASSASYTPGISERRDASTTFYHGDLKNGVAQSSSGGSLTGSKSYDAFGNLVSSSGTWHGPFSYGGPFGYQMDDDSGLALLGDRYYDASTGRFLSRDPSQEGSNWYIYVDNNPLTFADPDGNEVISLIIVGGLLVWRIYDTVTTVKDIIENPKDPTNYLGFVPGVGRVAKAIGKGSKPVGKAISNTAKKIAHGHAWKKHKHQFPWMTPNDLAKHVDDIIRKPSAKKKLKNGREAYWDEKSGTVVIVNPNDPDGGTVFKPDIGKQYFDHDLK